MAARKTYQPVNCQVCGVPSTLGFHVPNDLWDLVTGGDLTPRCIKCFERAAESKQVEWREQAHFFPSTLRRRDIFSFHGISPTAIMK